MEPYTIAWDLPVIGTQHAVRTPWATIIPPGRRVVAILDNSGASARTGALQNISVVSTLSQALTHCESGRGDHILVMPGHSESVAVTTMLANLVNDTHIVGVGSPDEDSAPTFRWTGQDAKWSVSKKNCSFENLRLKFEGANDITEAIGVSAAGVKFLRNWMLTGSGASNDCVRVIDVEANADDFVFAGNKVAQTAGTTTAVLNFGAAVARPSVVGNVMNVIGSSATAGAIDISAAITQAVIADNQLSNEATDATTCIKIADVAATGHVLRNLMRVLVAGNAYAEGILLAGSTNLLLGFFNNYCVDEKSKSGVLTPVVGT